MSQEPSNMDLNELSETLANKKLSKDEITLLLLKMDLMFKKQIQDIVFKHQEEIKKLNNKITELTGKINEKNQEEQRKECIIEAHQKEAQRISQIDARREAIKKELNNLESPRKYWLGYKNQTTRPQPGMKNKIEWAKKVQQAPYEIEKIETRMSILQSELNTLEFFEV